MQAKIHGTINLGHAFENSHLDFFLVLSSASGILGTGGQANYAAGNTFEDAFVEGQANSKTHFMSLDIGLVEGTITDNRMIKQSLQRQGLIPITPKELLAFFEYALSPEPRRDNCRQAILGFNAKSLSLVVDQNVTSKMSMFSHVWQIASDEVPDKNGRVGKSLTRKIQDTDGPEEAV